MRASLLFIIFTALTIFTGFFISQQPSYLLLACVVVPVIFIACFINPGIGLYILIFSMLLSPEFIVGKTTGGALERGVTLRIEDFLLLVIAGSWFFRTAVDKELGLFLKTPLNKPILYYVLACLVATGFGILGGRVSPGTGLLFVLKYIEYFIVFFMVVNHVRTEQQVKRFVFCLFLTCFIVSIVGIAQIPGGERVSAPFEGKTGEPNTLGGYLVFIMAIAVGLIYWVRNFKFKQFIILLVIIIIPPLMFTESRSSYLAFIPAAFTLAMMMKKRVLIVGALAAVIIISPLFLPAAVKNRISYTFNQPEEPGQVTIAGIRLDTSLSARLRSWQRVITHWPRQPLLGYGITGFGFIDAQFPRVLIETGIIGLIAFILLLRAVLKMAIDHYRMVATPFARGLCMGFIAGFVGLIFHSLGANTFIIVRIMEPFWFFAGLVYVLPFVEKQKEASTAD